MRQSIQMRTLLFPRQARNSLRSWFCRYLHRDYLSLQVWIGGIVIAGVLHATARTCLLSFALAQTLTFDSHGLRDEIVVGVLDQRPIADYRFRVLRYRSMPSPSIVAK